MATGARAQRPASLAQGPRHYEWASDKSRLEINLPCSKHSHNHSHSHRHARRGEKTDHLFCSRYFPTATTTTTTSTTATATAPADSAGASSEQPCTCPRSAPKGNVNGSNLEASQLSDRVRRIENDIDSVRLSADIASHETRLNGLSCEIEQCKRESERLRAGAAGDDRASRDLVARIDALTESQKSLVASIHKMRRDKQREIDREKENVRIGATRISNLRQDVTSKDCELDRMKVRVRTLRLDNETNKATADGYRGAYTALQDKLADTNKQLNDTIREREVLEGLCRKRDAMIASYKARFVAEGIDPETAFNGAANARTRRQQLETDVARMKQALADAQLRADAREIECREMKDELQKSSEALRLAARAKADNDSSIRDELRRLSVSLEQAHELRAAATAENEAVRKAASEVQLARDVSVRANRELQEQVRDTKHALDLAIRRAHDAECAAAAERSKLDECVRMRVVLEDSVREERASRESAQSTAARLSTEVALAVSQRDEASRSLRELQEILASTRNDLNGTRGSETALREQISRLQRDKEELELQMERRAVDVADARRAAETERQAREASQLSIRESLAILEAERKVRVEVEESRRGLESRIAELHVKLERSDATAVARADEAARRHDELLRALETERSRNAELTGRLEGHVQLAARQREEAAEQVRDLEAQLAASKGRVAELEVHRGQVIRLQERERSLQTELDEAKAAGGKAKARALELEGSQSAAAAAQQQCIELEEERGRLRSECARAASRIADLERCEKQLAEALARERDTLQDMHHLKLQNRVANSRGDEVDVVRRKLAQCEEREKKLKQEHAQAVAARDDALHSSASLERELVVLRQRDSAAASRLLNAAADGDELRTMLDEGRAERSDLLERCRRYEEEVEASRTKLERALNRNGELATELETVRRSERAHAAAAEEHRQVAADVARGMSRGADDATAKHARLVMSRVAALLDSVAAVAERLRSSSDVSFSLVDECCGAITAVCASGQEEISSHGTAEDIQRCDWCPDFEFLAPAIDAFERSRDQTREYLDDVHGLIGGDPAEFIRAKAKVVELNDQIGSLLVLLCRVVEIASSQMSILSAVHGGRA